MLDHRWNIKMVSSGLDALIFLFCFQIDFGDAKEEGDD